MRRLFSLVPLAALLLVSAAPAASASPGDPTAYAATACPMSTYTRKHLGTTYVSALRQHGTRCRHARKLVRAFNRCRHENGRAGHCSREVYDYSCKENRYAKGVGQYKSRVVCKKGSREVSWRYTQNT
jgi:hypothetical protein